MDKAESRALGAALRTDVDRLIRSAIDERFDIFGADVGRWSREEVQKSVHGIIAEHLRPLLRDLARAGAEIEVLREIVKRLDPDEVRAVAMHYERLTKAVEADTGERQAAREAEARIGRVLAEHVAAVGDVTALGKALGLRIEAIRADMEKAARDAVAAEMVGLYAQIDAEIDRMRAVSETREAIGKAGAALVPGAFRGPYRAEVDYARGELALWLGSTWIAKRRNRGEKPTVAPESAWALFAGGGIRQ